jgi:chorismate mutase / prephenate dehydratase
MQLTQEIIQLRDQIDDFDQKILQLINQRANLAKKIGHIKADSKLPVLNPERERIVLDNILKSNAGPIGDNSLIAIWLEIMSACRAIENNMQVAFLGPSGTFSEQAMFGYFGQSIVGIAATSIDETFKMVETHQTHFAIAPIENSTEGGVSRTLDLLLSTSCKIVGEIIIQVQHHLLSKVSNVDHAYKSAKIIAAHPQALAQCQQFLNNHASLRSLERQAVASNALAAQMAQKDESILAIASEQAANTFQLHKIYQHIQDEANNRTRFIILGHDAPPPCGHDQTSLVFSICNEAGSILKAIEPFKKYDVSMSRLQSRPAKQTLMQNNKDWEYYFLVDIDGHIQSPHIAQAIEEVKQNVRFFKCLGSYAKVE